MSVKTLILHVRPTNSLSDLATTCLKYGEPREEIPQFIIQAMICHIKELAEKEDIPEVFSDSFFSTKAFIYVGQKGFVVKELNTDHKGSFGGGGNLTVISLTNYGHGCIGGGASDIRLEKDDLYHRVIVAGAGGGASGGTSDIFENGGDAGGIEGERGYFDQDHTIYTAGGSQTSPGETHGVHCVREGYPGEFGKGGGTYNGCGTNYGGSGGGGWFGGAGGGHRISGAGGSGYAFNPTSHVPHGFLLKKSFYLINAQVLGGKSDFPSASPEFDLDKHETGHIGNGATRITFLGRIRTSFVKKDIHKLVLIFIMITVVC